MKIFKIILIGIGIVALFFLVIQIVNASKYKMVVNVPEGENVMGLNPLNESLDFGDLSRNNGMTRYITLKSEGGISTYIIVLKFGEISDLVKLSNNYFILKPQEEVKLAFDIRIPPSAETKKYSGWVWIFRLPVMF